MRSKSEQLRFVTLAICIASILSACGGKQWTREGTEQKIPGQDLSECEATAKMKGRADFPELRVISSMEFEPDNVTVKDINQDNFTRALLQYYRDCMLEKGYIIE